jgi:hypothetical protein
MNAAVIWGTKQLSGETNLNFFWSDFKLRLEWGLSDVITSCSVDGE